MKCRICGNEKENQKYEIREMMFGFRDVFSYFQCSNCNCLQIEEFPVDNSKYYPGNYYSYQMNFNQNIIRKFLAGLRDRYALFGKGFAGEFLYSKYPREDLRSLNFLHINKDTAILDIGCGTGTLLFSLKELGIKNLIGIDPFIEKDIEYKNGLRIQKKEIYDLKGKWDIIMFHHSFEHISEPAETLKTVSELLLPGGYTIIRVPIVPSYAWNHYGVNWAQLDAPRHLFLHSLKSMNILADQSGLELYKVIYDSTPFQFWGSEQYIKDIPLQDKRSYLLNPHSSIFLKSEITEFVKRTKRLNDTGEGDQAVFYFKRY